MASPSATTAMLLFLLLSLLAVAADHAAKPESTAGDENGLSSNPATLPAKSGASATEEEEALPAEQQHDAFEFLRLPSFHPCRLRRHPRWKPHHRVYYRDPACWFHDYDYDGERREAVSHLAILPAEEATETEPVAEPDPDRSLPDIDDGMGELAASREPSSFADDADGHDVEPWKKEMLRRWLRYAYFHFHHGMRRHRLHHVHQDHRHRHAKEAEKQAAGGDEQMSGVMAWIKGLMNRS